MPASAAAQPFRFEATFNTGDIDTRPELGKQPFGPITADHLFIAFGIAGVLLLFWIYTIALGAGVLAITTFAWGMREKALEGRKRSRAVTLPNETIRVGGDESEYWIEGQGFSARGAWSRVRVSAVRDDFVRVHAAHMPIVWLPIAALKSAGAYDSVRAILDERNKAFHEAMTASLRQAT